MLWQVMDEAPIVVNGVQGALVVRNGGRLPASMRTVGLDELDRVCNVHSCRLTCIDGLHKCFVDNTVCWWTSAL